MKTQGHVKSEAAAEARDEIHKLRELLLQV